MTADPAAPSHQPASGQSEAGQVHDMTPSVAIVGASSDRRKYGNRAVRSYASRGWRVYPVHPRETVIEGHRVYASLADLPAVPARVSLYVPPQVGENLVPELVSLAQRAERPDPLEVWLNPGSESDQLVKALTQAGLTFVVGCSLVAIGAAKDL